MVKRACVLLVAVIIAIAIIAGFSFTRIQRYSDVLPQTRTCLDDYHEHELHQTVFHSTMVHTEDPTDLSVWIKNKAGLEIGGPSPLTWEQLRIYDAARSVDVVNFASTTLWEKNLMDASPFVWKNKRLGKQYIRDAVNLVGISTDSYDFVCASHVLEHIANPFRALLEWIRILKPHGLIMLLLPLKEKTFDHRRNVDRIEHLLDDYRKQIQESDLSHLNDILRLHDLTRDPPAGNHEAFRNRSLNNFRNRGLHQHVYDQQLLYQMFQCLNLDVKIQITWDTQQLIIGEKRRSTTLP